MWLTLLSAMPIHFPSQFDAPHSFLAEMIGTNHKKRRQMINFNLGGSCKILTANLLSAQQMRRPPDHGTPFTTLRNLALIASDCSD